MPRNSKEYVLSTLDTVPASQAKAGQTVSTDGRYVTGVGTSFKSDPNIVEGDWIFADGEVRRIERIMSDTSAYLDEAFTAPLVADNLFITKASRAREISLVNVGGAATTINGTVFSAGVSKTYGEDTMYGGVQRDFPDPLVIDGATSAIEVLIIY